MQQELTIADIAAMVDSLTGEVATLARRVEQLEQAASTSARPRATAPTGAGSALATAAHEWATPYEVATLELGETWIEMHEPSARRQLHRLVCEVVATEGPVTEQLCLRRVREAWGIKRAGARIQQVFDQAIRQLDVAGHVQRRAGGVLALGEDQAERVRVPAAGDDATRRAIDEIPPGELELALARTVSDAGVPVDVDELTMCVARMFGWTRRGTEIQSTLDARVGALVDRGELLRDGAAVRTPVS